MDKIDMDELNELVMVTAGMMFFVVGVVGLFYFGLAIGN